MTTLLDPPTAVPIQPAVPRPAGSGLAAVRHRHDRACWWDLAAAGWRCAVAQPSP